MNHIDIKEITKNKIAVFFWIYCLLGIFIYAGNLSRLFNYTEAIPNLELTYNGVIYLFKYNILSNLFLLLGLVLIVYFLFKRKASFLKMYLWHTLLVVIVNFYNEYLIAKASFPVDLSSFFDNTAKGSVVLVWLIFWSLLIEKYDKGKKYFIR